MRSKILLELDNLINEIETYHRRKGINLPEYDKFGKLIPQCHICTERESEYTPLFAYSYHNNQLIYRCVNGHGHDNEWVLTDILTNLPRNIK